MSFLHRLVVLNLFSTKQTPDTWNTHTHTHTHTLTHTHTHLFFASAFYVFAKRVTVAFGKFAESKWLFYPATLRESVSQIKEVVRLTVVSALP